MNSHIVEKTMHSIKNIDRLTDLAAIDVYNTTHDTINKYEIMKEHATEEYTNESFYQESVLAGVLIGAGVLGVAISAFFIIKKIIDTKAAGDSSVKSSDGKPVAANVDLRDPKSAEKYKSAVAARIGSLTDSTQIKISKKVNTEAFNAVSKQIGDIITSLESIVDNKSDADEISKIINGMKLEAIDLGKVVENVEETATKANFVEAIGLDNMISLAKLVKDLEDKINGVEKTVNQKGANKKDGENTIEVPADVMNKLKNDTKVNQNIIDALLTSARSFMETTDASVVGAAKTETEAKNKDEEAKPTNGTGSNTPQNVNPQAQSSETVTPVAQNSRQDIPPSSTPLNLNFQASGFNGGNPAPAANPQAAATGGETPTPVSGDQSVEPNLGTNFLNAANKQKQQHQNENLTQQFGSNTARENSNVENWINAANANNAGAEAEKKPEDQVKTKPENPPTPTDQTSSDDEKITKIANKLYGIATNANKNHILEDLNRLKEGESSVITALDNVKNEIRKGIEDGVLQPSDYQSTILDMAIPQYEAIAKEFGINADYLKSYAKTIPTEVSSEPKMNNSQKSHEEQIEKLGEKFTNLLKSGKNFIEAESEMRKDRTVDANILHEVYDKLGINWHRPMAELNNMSYTELIPSAKSEENTEPEKQETTSENENKEKSKPTASDFENFKNPEVNPESQQRFNSEINNADKSSTQSVQSDEAALRQAALNRQAEVSSEPEKVAIADEDVKNLITFSNIPENFANDISKTITDDINNNIPFNAQHIKDMATNLSKENGEDFVVNAKQLQKVFRDMAAACKPQTDAVKQYIDAIDKTDINSLKPEEASAPVNNKPQLSPEEMTNQIVNNINQIPTSAINNANTLVSSSYDDATKQQIAKEVISKLQSSGQTAAAGSFASSLKTSLGYTDADLNSSELPLYGSEKGTYEPLTGKNQAMNMISNNPVDNGMIETVARLRNEGLDDDQIRQKLLAANWKPELIEGMLQKVNNIEVQNNPNPTSIPNQTGVINVDAAAENATPQNAQNNESIQYNISKALNDYKSTPFAQKHVNGLSAYGLENEVNNIITRAQSLRNTGVDPAKSITMREAFNNLWKQTGGGFGIPSKDKKKALEAAKEYTKLRMTEAGVGDFFQEMFALDSEYRRLIQECDIAIIREEKLKLIQEQQTDPEE